MSLITLYSDIVDLSMFGTDAPGTLVQSELKERIRSSSLRADSAHSLVDLAVANPSFTVRKVEAELNLSYGRANRLVGQLVELGVLRSVKPDAYNRRFFAPRVLDVLTADSDGTETGRR